MTRAVQRHSIAPSEPPVVGERQAADRLGQECARAHATLLQRGYVQFHAVLADLVGGFKGALMLGHALYWTRTWLQRRPERDGWFWKTAVEWRDATALSPREQESARKRLRAAGFWQERRAGAPALLHFRVDLQQLASQLAALSKDGGLPTCPEDRLAALLGQPIIYYRPLADLAGGPAAGLVLSHLIAAQRTAMRRREVHEGGYFLVHVEEARATLGLGTKVQRNAREALKRAGFVQEAWTREQCPRLMVRLNLDAIVACLGGQEHRPIGKRSQTPAATQLHADEHPVPQRAFVAGYEGNVTRVIRLLLSATAQHAGDHTEPEGRPRVAERSNLVVRPRVEPCPFVETRVALLSDLYSKRDSSNPPPAPARDGDRVVDDAASRRSRRAHDFRSDTEAVRPPAACVDGSSPAPLVCPEALDPALHDGACRIVDRAPVGVRQALLDELAGHLASKRKVIENPLGWLHSVTSKAMKGDLVLTMAAGVAAARERKARLAVAVASAAAAEQPKVRTTPAEAASARARLRALRNQLKARAFDASTTQPPDGRQPDEALSQKRTTHDGCALSQNGTTDSTNKGTEHATHES